jgi:putative oxidoreductase
MKSLYQPGERKETLHDAFFALLSRFPFARWAPIPLRLIVGYGFMEHGYAKILKGPEHFVAIVHAMGVPAPELMAWATIIVELAGGFAVLAGAFVPLVSGPMAAILVTAALTVHLPYGFASIKIQAVTAAGAQFGQPGYETDLLYLACLAALVLAGPGPFAVDGLLARLAARQQLGHTSQAPRQAHGQTAYRPR